LYEFPQQELIECAAGISFKGDNVTKELKDAMARIAGISADVESSITEIREALKVGFRILS
jgi:peroxiredoxin